MVSGSPGDITAAVTMLFSFLTKFFFSVRPSLSVQSKALHSPPPSNSSCYIIYAHHSEQNSKLCCEAVSTWAHSNLVPIHTTLLKVTNVFPGVQRIGHFSNLIWCTQLWDTIDLLSKLFICGFPLLQWPLLLKSMSNVDCFKVWLRFLFPSPGWVFSTLCINIVWEGFWMQGDAWAPDKGN